MSTRKRTLPHGWYPSSARECQRDTEEFLQGFSPPPGNWKGGVAPHAGWFFSGKAAARLMKTLSQSAPVDRIVVYGGHLGGAGDPIVYTEDGWETPFGEHPMDAALAHDILAACDAKPAPRGFSDNTVEIQIPFVATFFSAIPLIAVHAPASSRAIGLGRIVSGLLEEKGLSALYIGSSDLTHYGPNYGFSPVGTGPEAVTWVKEENDRALIDKALAMDAEGLLDEAETKRNTCSAGPIVSVMSSVATHGVSQGVLLDYYTSFDVMPNSSFVGYAAIVF